MKIHLHHEVVETIRTLNGLYDSLKPRQYGNADPQTQSPEEQALTKKVLEKLDKVVESITV